MKLYEINNEIQRILDGAVDEETGEVLVDFDALDELIEARDAKVQSCGLHYLNRQAEVEMLKVEIDRLTKRMKSLASQNNGLLGYIERNLAGAEFTCPQFSVKYSKSQRIEVDDVFTEYARRSRKYKNLVRTKFEPDKTAIGKLLKAGEKVPYAQIVQHSTMKIK